jgi:hypothetical protein
MASSVDSPVDTAHDAARSAHDSRPVEVLARLGRAARGLVWLVLSALAFSLVLGQRAQADQEGALRALAAAPFGGPLLAVLAAGFAGYALWLLLEAAVGYRNEESPLLPRARAGVKGLVYLALGVSTISFLARGSGSGSAESRTAQVMSNPGGRTAVGVVGAVLVGVGIYLAFKGIRRKHAECLEDYRVPGLLRRPAILCGAVGYVGRGVTIGLVGAFVLRAAIRFDPDEAKGLDAVLQTVAQQPYGRILLGLTVIGMLGYALWSFVEAAFRKI